MAKFITQETFDEVVKENIEDFGMDKEAAAADAIAQFKSQGADLTMVDTSADGVRRDAKAVINGYLETLRSFDTAPEGDARIECIDAMAAVGEVCREEGPAGEANRMAVGETNDGSLGGGVGVLARFLSGDTEDTSPGGVVRGALSALYDTCRNQERNRDAFIYSNMAQLNALLLRWTSSDSNGQGPGSTCSGHGGQEDQGDQEGQEESKGETRDCAEDGAALVAAGLRLVRAVCTKAENNKGSFMRHKGAAVLLQALERFGSGDHKDASVTKEACGALRSVTLGDDRRKDFSGTYDNVKALVCAGAVSLLLDAAKAFQDDSGTVSWVYLALKQLAANDDSVKLIVEKGGLELVSGAIVNFPLDPIVCRAALALFRNISANDVLKTRLLNEGGLRLVLGCMAGHKDDKALQEHGCATMAAMALRSPANGARIVSEGGIRTMVEAMRRHATVQGLQRQACLCIRNIAARGPSLRQAMLDEGCETALREAGKLRGCVDEAYGALRDLQCDVGLVSLGEGGEVQVGVKAFGEQKANFNPSLLETNDLSDRIEGSATAPKHAGYMM